MKQIEIVIHNRTGLHARPAKVLVNLAKQFKSDIRLQYGEKKANAKSMVSVLTLGAVSGSQITLQVDRSEEHTSELQSRRDLVCRLLLEKKKKIITEDVEENLNDR